MFIILTAKEKESRQELAQVHIHNSKSNLQIQNQYGQRRIDFIFSYVPNQPAEDIASFKRKYHRSCSGFNIPKTLAIRYSLQQTRKVDP